MITKKISVEEVVPVALFLIILLLTVSCGGDTGDSGGTSADKQDESNTANQGAPDQVEGDSVIVSTPVYLGSSRFRQTFIEKLTKRNKMNPRRYTRDSMIAITVPYIRRVKKGAQVSPPPPPNRPANGESVNINKERMLVYLDKPTLKLLLDDNSETTGLIAIFAVEKDSLNRYNPKNQTFILVPFNIDSMRAVTMKGEKTVGVVGYERWPTYVDLTTYQTGDVKVKVDSVYTVLGIN